MIDILYFPLLWIWTVLAIPVFLLLLKVKAPFGRHSTTKWGPSISNKWAWFLMELPALVVMPAFYFAYATNYDYISIFLVVAWVLHYFNRVCIFPFRIHTRGKQMPIVIALMAFFFNLTNGFLCGYFFAVYADYATGETIATAVASLGPLFILGLAIFVCGMFINWQADNILISLRKPGESHYVIPQGGLFRWVSCPNLLGEIIEWSGFALMATSLPTTAFALWTIANLLPRALAHHKWYHSKFPSYPPERKAIIPFLL